MYNFVFYIIIGIIIFDYFLERGLSYLNSKNRNLPLPTELEGIYDEEKLGKAISYDRENANFEWITSSFNTFLVLLMLVFGGFAIVNTWAGEIISNPVYTALVFFAILGLASDLIHTPFSIYDTFVIEQKYGFNKTTPKIFILDKLKGYLLSAIIGGVLMGLVIWFYYKTTSFFWIYAWVLITVFMIVFSMFYSNLIVPLFNKQKPLEEGELKDAINELALKLNFKLDNIYTIDGSKRSTKANAYFTGLGAKKRVVLYDTLIKELSTDEIVGVLAHEIGHYKHKHTQKGLIISVIQTGITLYIMSVLIRIPSLSQAMGVSKPSFHIGILAFGILYSPISMIIGLFMNILSRKHEYQADAFAVKYTGSTSLINALKKLSINNLSNLNPHKAYVFFHYSHPTLLQRIRAMQAEK